MTVDPGQVLTVRDPLIKHLIAYINTHDRSSTTFATASTKRKQTKYMREFLMSSMSCIRASISEAGSR
jgi:hypothetical protein